jgi:hypothetical protein
MKAHLRFQISLINTHLRSVREYSVPVSNYEVLHVIVTESADERPPQQDAWA